MEVTMHYRADDIVMMSYFLQSLFTYYIKKRCAHLLGKQKSQLTHVAK